MVHLYLFRPTQKRLSLYGVVPLNITGYIYNGASPWRGWMALGQRRYICTVYRVIPFTRTGYIRYVAGGRLPPLQYICYKYHIFYVSNVGFAFQKMRKHCTLP